MNEIHPTAVLGDGVVLGDGNVIGPYAVLLGPCTLGDDNWVGPHVVVGTPPAVRGGPHPAGWSGAIGPGSITIGSRNVIREHTGIQHGANRPASIGDDCYLMSNVHVSHDAAIGSGVTITCGAQLAGHVTLGDGANLGMGTVVHQRITIGRGVMTGMGAVIVRDVPDWALVYGNPARVRGANRVGLERAGFAATVIDDVERRLLAGDPVTGR